jgi:hypothetical protein
MESLKDLPGDMDIIIGTDEEGNDFQNLYYHPSVQWCVKDNTRCGLMPVDELDVESGEYELDELVQRVVI